MARGAASSAGRAPVRFVDTNVLVYAHDASEPAKRAAAKASLADLWANGSGRLSTQVLQEFYVVATRKTSLGMSPLAAREVVRLYSTWPVVIVDPILIDAAADLHTRQSISLWDALIVAAAQQAGADEIPTEDLADGETFDGVRVVNPFRS